jgi:hypothetical protein
MDHDLHVRHISLAGEFPFRGIPLQGKCASPIFLAREFPYEGNSLAREMYLIFCQSRPSAGERQTEGRAVQGLCWQEGRVAVKDLNPESTICVYPVCKLSGQQLKGGAAAGQAAAYG